MVDFKSTLNIITTPPYIKMFEIRIIYDASIQILQCRNKHIINNMSTFCHNNFKLMVDKIQKNTIVLCVYQIPIHWENEDCIQGRIIFTIMTRCF